MMVKVIIQDKIITYGRVTTDADLKNLNCYYESFPFEIDPDKEYEKSLNMQ